MSLRRVYFVAAALALLISRMTNPNPIANAQESVPREQLPTVDPARLNQPEELHRFCELVRQQNREITARLHQLVHTESTTTREFDRKGNETGREDVVERVRFAGDQEYRLVLKKQLGGKDTTPPSAQEVKPPKMDMLFPLAGDELPNTYRYSFAGIETIGGRPAVKINYEPLPPIEKRFRGQVWIDAATCVPVRFFGAWAKLPPLVNEMTMLLDWGPSEVGQPQLRRSIVNGRGGLAFFQKRYRIETDLNDYRQPQGQ